MYSEKATKFYEISTLILSYVLPDKSKVDILQNFVAFSEYMQLYYIFFQDKNHKWSKSIQLFCISFLGAFTFWSYTGILTSLSAVQSFSIPVKSLDDLQKMTNFELYIYGGGSTQTLLEKWAQSPKETDIWRRKAFQKFIKTGFEDDDKLKMIFDEILNGDSSSDVALLNDKDEMGKIFEQSMTK